MAFFSACDVAKVIGTHGWSRSILEIQIQHQLHLRAGKAQNNFALTIPSADSDIATQLFKDPCLFDFLGTADPRRGAEVEQALVDHIQNFLLELGVIWVNVHCRMTNPERAVSPTPSGLWSVAADIPGRSPTRNPGLNDGIPVGFNRRRSSCSSAMEAPRS